MSSTDIQIHNTGWTTNLVNFLWSGSERRPDHYTDFEFRCRDGVVRAHGSYLRSVCPIFADFEAAGTTNVVLIVPDFSVGIVSKFLEIVYTGTTRLEDVNEFEKIREFGFGQLRLKWNLKIFFPCQKSQNQSLTETSKIVQTLNSQTEVPTNRTEHRTTAVEQSEMEVLFSANKSVLSNVPTEVRVNQDLTANDDILLTDEAGMEEAGMESILSNIDSVLSSKEKQNMNCSTEAVTEINEEELLSEIKIESDDLDLEENLDVSLTSNNESEDDHLKISDEVEQEMSEPGNQSEHNMTSSKETGKQKQKLDPSELECSVCHNVLDSLNALLLHYRQIHLITKPYKCKSCGLNYSSKSSVVAHLRLNIFTITLP